MKSDLMITAPRSGNATELRAFIDVYQPLARKDIGVAVEVELAQWRLERAQAAQSSQAA
jgi:hypothetical protein